MAQHGIFEQDLITWCQKFILPDMDFVDIGAHSGTYALSLAPYCRRVYAFEAQRMTYYQLCGGIALNQYSNVWPIHCALGDAEGTVNLHITSADGGGSTVDDSIPNKQHLSVLAKETCQLKTLDSWRLFPKTNSNNDNESKNELPPDGLPKDNVKIGLIKIDVEGFEQKVLRGAKETIKQNGYPPILFEAWPDQWFRTQRDELLKFILNDLAYSKIAVMRKAQDGNIKAFQLQNLNSVTSNMFIAFKNN
jgi:FkbM family methyltransferase